MSIFQTYGKEGLAGLVEKHNSLKDILIAVGLVPRGRNFATLKKYLSQAGLYETLVAKRKTAQVNLREHRLITKDIFLNEKLKLDSRIASDKLKRLLIKFGLKTELCEECGIFEWANQKLSLHVHHKDGNHNNNELGNLVLLCPNCHSLTENYAGKRTKPKASKKCSNCGVPISSTSIKCRPCALKSIVRKELKDYPELHILAKDIKELGYSATGRKYGMSDNAIRKHLQKYLGVSYKSIILGFDPREGGALPPTLIL